MTMQPAVRRATFADSESLAPVFDAYRTFFTGASDPDGSRAFLSDRLQREESVVFGAFDGERTAGFLQLYPLFSSWYAKRQWFLSDLFVDPEYQRRGIARRLLDASTQFARETQSRSVLVELPFSEPHLIKLYEAAGYGRDTVFALYRLTLAGA
ncbi:MAG TPA: GNAT family N-acetyltransferase [Candidatus Tumulicola sp.]|jgi:GNAT superfamily N-acetyltransferase